MTLMIAGSFMGVLIALKYSPVELYRCQYLQKIYMPQKKTNKQNLIVAQITPSQIPTTPAAV
jgi:hypothetical protein